MTPAERAGLIVDTYFPSIGEMYQGLKLMIEAQIKEALREDLREVGDLNLQLTKDQIDLIAQVDVWKERHDEMCVRLGDTENMYAAQTSKLIDEVYRLRGNCTGDGRCINAKQPAELKENYCHYNGQAAPVCACRITGPVGETMTCPHGNRIQSGEV